MRFHVDCFSSADHLIGRKRTYAAIKDAVLAAGRFSVFEATNSNKDARLFTQLHHDPELVCDHTRGYPWIYVSRLEDRCATP